MNKKLLITLSLMAISAKAMEQKSMELTIPNEQALPITEEKIVIIIEDQKRELPSRYVSLIKSLSSLIEVLPTTSYEEGIPIPDVSLATWQRIEDQLEHVYVLTHGDYQARGKIVAAYRGLKNAELIDLIMALEQLNISPLKDIVLELAQYELTSKEILELSTYIRNEVIKRKAVYEVRNPFPIGRTGGLYAKGAHDMHQWLGINSICVMQDEKCILGSEGKDVLISMGVPNNGYGNLLAYGGMGIRCRGHEGAIQSVCFSPEGRIVSGSKDKTVRIWDMTGQQRAVCRGHDGEIWGVCLTPDGKMIVSGSQDGTVRCWDLDGQEHDVFRGHEAAVTAVCVAPDGRIISGSKDKTVRIWGLNGQEPVVCTGHEDAVTAVSVTSDGKRIVSGSMDGSVRIWDVTGQALAVYRRYEEDCVRLVCITNDNKIAAVHEDKTIILWNLKGQQLGYAYADEGGVKSICVDPNGRLISVGENQISAWNISLLDSFWDRLSDMSRTQAELIVTRIEWTEGSVEEFWPDYEEATIARISAHFWKEVKNILDNEELAVKSQKRKENENGESNPAKKVKLTEEEKLRNEENHG